LEIPKAVAGTRIKEQWSHQAERGSGQGQRKARPKVCSELELGNVA